MKKLILFFSLFLFSCKKEVLQIPNEFDSKICILFYLDENKVFLNQMTVSYYVTQNNLVSYYTIEKSKDLYFKNPTYQKHDSISTNKVLGQTSYETFFSDTLTNTLKIKMYQSNKILISERVYDLRKLKLITP